MNHALSSAQIAEKLQITPPFLMITQFMRVAEQQAEAKMKTSKDDWFFQCHLPEQQVMPATLVIEGMLQTLVLLIYESIPHPVDRAFVTQLQSQIIQAIKPDQLVIFHAKIISSRRGITKGEVIGMVEEKIVCKGQYTYASPHLMQTPKVTR